MTNRRDFCKAMGAMGLAAAAPDLLFGKNNPAMMMPGGMDKKNDKMIWAYLIHLSYNMWEDYPVGDFKWNTYPEDIAPENLWDWAKSYQPHLTCDMEVWDTVMKHLSETGANMVVIDLGDGVKYKSHPEISVEGAWSRKLLKQKLAEIRALGMEPIPKLNFSTGHKAWLADYQYCVSSKSYYKVCRDLIEEVIDLFDKPRFFHIGMDEETCENQTTYRYSVVRRQDLWWHDLYYFVDLIEKHNIQAWIWSDVIWREKEEFLKKMPKSVIQSNWNYYLDLAYKDDKPYHKHAQAFLDLEEHGFTQIPTGSYWTAGHWGNETNFDCLVRHCKRDIAPERLAGFLQTIWGPTLKPFLDYQLKAVDKMAEARKKYY